MKQKQKEVMKYRNIRYAERRLYIVDQLMEKNVN
jgi:hypothetical protein